MTKKQPGGLAAQFEKQAEAQQTAAQKALDSKLELARAFDTSALDYATRTGKTLAPPAFLHVWKLWNTVGSLHYENQTPEDLLILIEAFPAVPAGLHRATSGVSFKPAIDATKEPEQFQPGDGYSVRMSGGIGYNQKTEVKWFSELSGALLVEVSAELFPVHGVIPMLQARYQEAAGEHIAVQEDWSHWPVIAGPAAYSQVGPRRQNPKMPVVTYARGSRSAMRDHLFWSEAGAEFGVVAQVRAWADECFKRRTASRAAYEADKIAGVEPTHQDHREGPYASRKLRAGTETQTACLESKAAQAERALAEKHWKEYAKDKGIESTRGYFDYFSWACWWLEQHSLLSDPNGPSKDGKGYKYGSAWL